MLDATFWSYIRKFRITFYQSQNKLPFIHILIFFRTRKILRSTPISLLRYIKDTSDRKTGLGLFLQYPSPKKIKQRWIIHSYGMTNYLLAFPFKSTILKNKSWNKRHHCFHFAFNVYCYLINCKIIRND